MSNTKHYRAAPGRVVIDPVTGERLPGADQDSIPINLNHSKRRHFYPRRLKDGDVIEGQFRSRKATPPEPAAPATQED